MPNLHPGRAYEAKASPLEHWRDIPDDRWDTIMATESDCPGDHAGTRDIDGMRMNVFDCGGGIYRAQTCPVSN